MAFISLDAVRSHQNGTRPAKINVAAIAYIVSAGDQHDPAGNTAIYFGSTVGGNAERPLIVQQTVDQVVSAIEAASA